MSSKPDSYGDDRLDKLLTLTHEMYDAVVRGEIDIANKIAVERDELMHAYFSRLEGKARKPQVIQAIHEIIELNTRMIERSAGIESETKKELKIELEKEMKAAEGVRAYTNINEYK